MNAIRRENKQVNFWVSDDEHIRLTEIATQYGYNSVAGYSKAKVCKSRLRPQKIDNEGAKKIAYELNKIGNNVNQIAKKCNSGDRITHDEIAKLREELNAIWQLLNVAIQK